MAATVPARQPFGVLDGHRLQTLSSTKNRQNAITASLSSMGKPGITFSPPGKSGITLSPPVKRPRQPSYEEDFDAENIDPSIFNSPSKRKKTLDGTPMQKPVFIFTDSAKPTFTPVSGTPLSTKTTPALSISKAATSPLRMKTTPISASRGSPKQKRAAGLLSKRRASSSPYTRVNPPNFSRSRHVKSSLPFSIDAALSGTISSYTPKSSIAQDDISPLDVTPALPTKAVMPAAPATIEESMPKGWFFDIYEDSPDEEAANLMEHSTNILDISSDDDSDCKRRAEREERGKENIPPPDWVVPNGQRSAAATLAVAMEAAVEATVAESTLPKGKPTSSKLRQQKLATGPDAMVEDMARSPLGDLEAKDFYPTGLDETSIVTYEGEAQASEHGDGPAAKVTFDFTAHTTTTEAKVSTEAETHVETAASEPVEETKAAFAIWDAEKTAVENVVAVLTAEETTMKAEQAVDEAVVAPAEDVTGDAAAV